MRSTLKLDSTTRFLTTTTLGGPKSKYTRLEQETDMRGSISFLKWAGGKGQLIHELRKNLPTKFNNYYEPFAGGASLFFFIKKNLPDKKCTISDINEELISSFKVVKYNLKELIQELKKLRENYDKKGVRYYYEVRDLIKDVEKLSDIEKAARFIFLNKTCWNGLYRVNSEGKFNVPSGKYKNPKIFDEKNLREVRKLLIDTKIMKADFSVILKLAKKGDFIYFDPPYFPISKTSCFTDYTKSGFNEEDQKKLGKIFKKLDRRGCFIMLSNSDTKLIRELYKDYKKYIRVVHARRAINRIGSKRGPINELIIRNY